MVMEAATLSGPQRKCNVVPVQKSLSLPSYARVGGEGIDHRLIFAALEQKEKVRRKSKIFTREKTARQNIFCLPISTGSKCRETSLSSDTSCSSLEYQKPKPAAKAKKADSEQVTKSSENEPLQNEHPSAKTSLNKEKLHSACLQKDTAKRQTMNGHAEQNYSLNKHNRSPVDTFRLNVGSSDSMERSSRSSNDSLSRKERLVAIKARVEAEREKYGHSSSEEESRSNITRYNSDGVIHRTVRDVKSKASRHERRLRRRSQGEWAIKKADRKNNLSLCLNPEEDGIKLHLEKLTRLNCEINNLEVKTDYCSSPIFPDVTKKSYFSDFPCKENVTKFVQQRVKHIEQEEKKRRSGSDFFDKLKISSRASPILNEKLNSPSEYINKIDKSSGSNTSTFEKSSRNNDIAPYPSPKTTQAPTPPPRSPKSITYVNKAFLQHQTVTLGHHENSFNKNKFVHPSITTIIPPNQPNKYNEVISRDSRISLSSQNNPAEKQNMRELFSSRRKTCGNFDFVDEKVLSELCSAIKPLDKSNLAMGCAKSTASLTHVKNISDNSYSDNTEVSPCIDFNKNNWKTNKWLESESRREYMFNSLENKKKNSILPWTKKNISIINSKSCNCHLVPGGKLINKCTNCGKSSDMVSSKDNSSNIFNDKTWAVKNENNTNCFCSLIPENITCECKSKSSMTSSQSFTPVQFKTQEFSPKLTLDKEDKFSPRMIKSPLYRNSNAKQNDQPKEINIFNKTSFDVHSTNSSSSLSISDNSATANLDSAMAELESVYLSLKMSSDNLTDNSNTSSTVLNKDNSKANLKSQLEFPKGKDSLYGRNFIQLTKTYGNINNPEKKYNNVKCFDNILSIPETKTVVSANAEDCIANMSINDLFKDIAPQLNTDDENTTYFNDPETIGNIKKSSKLDDKIHINVSPVGFKKEFFENLQKQNVSQHRKKLKAVRSLSENISQLMNSPNNVNLSTTKSLETTYNKTQHESTNNSFKLTTPSSLKTELKHELVNGKLNTFENNHSHDEIRQIRVSMDSTVIPSVKKPVSTCCDTTKYSRLTSAVQSPQASPKCEVSRPFQFHSYSDSKETIEKTIDGLEELLNSLLVDVPETNQSSLLKKQDHQATPPPSPVATSGEMRVLQLLDVIRLKPVPS